MVEVGSGVTRESVERLVRERVYREMGLPVPRSVYAPNPLVVNVSARHCHLTRCAVAALFGEGSELTPVKWLYQEGYFAAKETVTLVGPRSRVISNLRILGPCRDINQVELASSDAIALGFAVPLRLSGNIEGTPGGMLMGPKGFFQMDCGIIRAAPHVHMSPEDARYYGVKHGDIMKLRVGGELPVEFGNLEVRVGEGLRLEVHIDTDEGNACNLRPGTPCELIK
jgi:putative phosphotransacetylase